MNNKICQQCNNTFTHTTKCHHSKKTWEAVKYCSSKCSHEGSKGQNLIQMVCWECKQEFKVKPYRKDTAHFCSHDCAARYRDEGKRTADKKLRQSAAYRKWREAVMKRDDYRCVECGDGNYKGRGKTVVLQADHIKPFRSHPELRLELINGRTLCLPCHKQTDTFGVWAWRGLRTSAQEA